MSDSKIYRTKDEWFALIQEARKSGLSDAQWCQLNGISRHSLNTAIKRLRKCAYAIPARESRDIASIYSFDVSHNSGEEHRSVPSCDYKDEGTIQYKFQCFLRHPSSEDP